MQFGTAHRNMFWYLGNNVCDFSSLSHNGLWGLLQTKDSEANKNTYSDTVYNIGAELG